MQLGEIFRYTDPREILLRVFQEKKERDSRFSLRTWSRQLGFKNPSYLSEIMRGKAKVKPRFALQVSDTLDIADEKERRYFELLAFWSDASSPEEKDFFSSALNRLRPLDDHVFVAKEDDFVISRSNWVAWFVDDMVPLKDFREDPSYLAKRIGDDVTPQSVELAIKEAEALGLIVRDAKGKLIRPRANYLDASKDVDKFEMAYNKFWKQFWKRKERAYFEQSRDESTFHYGFVIVAKKHFHKARDLIKRFTHQLTDLSDVRDGEELYALDLSFFRMTLGDSDMGKVKK